MRKFFCTLSLFVGALALAAASWFVRLPDYTHLLTGQEVKYMPFEGNSPLPLWMLIHIVTPLALLFCIAFPTYALWCCCGVLCKKLRGEA